MELALLGTDSESVALAQSAEALGHKVVWCGDVGDSESLEGEDLGAEWESLLDQGLADAVIVGRGMADPRLRAEQVNQLTKSGISLLTTFPLIDSLLPHYEIDMARGESDALLRHFNPLTEQAQVIELCTNSVAAGHPQVGAIEQVVWERPLADRSQQQVLWHFSRDVELLCEVTGGLNRLAALGSPDEAATYSGLSVQLLGKSEVPVRWQVGPVDQEPGPRLNLIGERGRVTFEFNETSQALRMAVSMEGKTETTQLENVDAAAAAVERFVDDIRLRREGASSWTSALSAMELTDTIEISLRRGRMIEVHQQQLTEQMAFKGTMSAIGCGVLLLVPPLLLFLGWAAEMLGVPVRMAKIWPYPLLALLGLFLLVQLLPKLINNPRKDP